ncbi:sensor histidine kinase [Streptomyces albofaciens JCM 4342]|uniref:sensor histidine kinase n=1 Tax=Streptomyces albofaciens TaxID=66866 RepID=UPI00123AF5E4|nr:sensor histidine kinase [Streptomyces albofaciens]KAA6222939.1 sensor histidine kinase [Streptomyces albofaciens JCM 4342]
MGENGASARTWARKRLVTAVKGLPRALREDLVAGAVGPPPGERPGWLIWQPVIVLLLALGAPFLCALSVNDLLYQGMDGFGQRSALLLGVVQGLALIVAAFRPVVAWWIVTAAMVVVVVGVEYGAARHGLHPWPGAGPAAIREFPVDRGGLYPWTAAGLAAQAVVLLLLALRLRFRAAAGALGVTLLAGLVCGVAAVRLGAPLRASSIGLVVAVLVAATIVGAALRGRQVARTELVAQEGMTTEERARRTLLEERNRIARELHDVVAHHMSVISIQAQVAPYLAENPSDALKENLAGIRANAVEALTELRRVLGVLRSEEAPAYGTPEYAGDGTAPHAPQPTLDRLDELVGNVRAAGVTVTTDVTGTRRPLSPGVELSAFRIVQEALSNAMRHAPGARVAVAVAYRPAALTLRVTNTAPDRPVTASPGAGHGLLGMRERTAMLGGELATGPTPDGGYEVTAVLPTGTPTGAPAEAPDPSPTPAPIPTPTPSPHPPADPTEDATP